VSNNDLIVPGFDDEKNDQINIVLKKVTSLPKGLVFELKGHVDTYNSPFFQKRVSKAIRAGFVDLIFNANGLNYLSSTGIGCFAGFLKELKPLGGDVVIMGIQPKVLEIFRLLGFEQFFYFAGSIEEAVRYFSVKKNTQGPFPKAFACPICNRKLKTSKSGKFRCPECKSIIIVNEKAEILLG
jgi:anti-sigma B factor antagonist